MDRSRLGRRLVAAAQISLAHDRKAARMSTIDEFERIPAQKSLRREKHKRLNDNYFSRHGRARTERNRHCRCQQNNTSETDLSDTHQPVEANRPSTPSEESDLPSSVPFVDEFSRRKRRRWPWLPERQDRAQMLPVFVASTGTFVVGFSLAYHALSEFLSAELASHLWVQNLFCICGIFGAIFLGMIIRWPRKRLLSITSVAQVVSWILVLFGKGEFLMLASRSVAGLCSGVTVGLVQVYVSEIAHPSNRGLASSVPTFASILGSLTCFSASRGISWYYVGICGLIVSILYTLAVVSLLPESFRYLIRQGKADTAMKTLEKLRGRPEIHPEFNAVQDACDILSFERNCGSMNIFRPEFYRPVFIAGAVMFFGQFSGIDGVLLFAFDRYKEDTPSNAGFVHFPVVVLYSVQLVATLVCGFLVDRTGKKLMLLISTATCAVAGLGLGLFVLFEDLGLVRPGFAWNWVPVACVIIYTGAFSLGLGPVPWMLFGEFLPYYNKGLAAVLIGILFWVPSLGINITFSIMQSALYLSGTLWFYTIFCIFGYLFVLLKLPDWKCVSLETIQLHFASSKSKELVQRY